MASVLYRLRRDLRSRWAGTLFLAVVLGAVAGAALTALADTDRANLAAAIPGWRAARLLPTTALRSE